LYFIYIDETGDETSVGFSALAIPVAGYRDILESLKRWRKQLRASDGIYTTTEFHAAKFTSGRGQLGLKGRGISQRRRCEIFDQTLSCVADLPDVHLLNAFRLGDHTAKAQLLERFLTRIHTAVQSWDSQAILLFDEGDARKITHLSRRLSVYNPIKSKFGVWPDGQEYKNFPLVRFLEDPIFRISRNSYFIQAVDFCAYALFQKEKQTPSRARFGLHESLSKRLAAICVTAASPDPMGIIR
jgi:hypothetical protein